MFRDIKDSLRSTYNSMRDDISSSFYNNVLKESVLYERVSGYFSAKGLAQYAEGLDKLARNNGIAKFIISTDISEQDFESIQKGYELKSETADLSENDERRLGNLAYMIAQGNVEIKFGLVNNGLFHSKWGLFEDQNKETIYFIGSNNETSNAMDNNYEDFNVDNSWDISPNVRSRINEKKQEFDRLWNGQINGVVVKEATDLVYKTIQDYNRGEIQEVPEDNQESVLFDMTDEQDGFIFQDLTEKQVLGNKIIQRKVEYYVDEEKGFPYISYKFNYRDLERMLDKIGPFLKKRFHVTLIVSDRVKELFSQEQYSIEEFQKAGLTLKSQDDRWDKEYDAFKAVVSKEIVRPLKPLQMRSAFYMYVQKRAANFSVPGAGKTAMLLGVFAYLNQSLDQKVDRILVVSPINAFTSWREEFVNVFGDKKKLAAMSVHDDGMTELALRSNWSKKNLVLVNYESLQKYGDALAAALKEDHMRTMLVFDEVHRIKGIDAKRALEAEKLVNYVPYKYVLTGTPIPNGYQDIWNFLHILFDNEYDAFFNFPKSMLKNPNQFDVKEINEKLRPFFWRTSKDDLGVPKANEDQIFRVAPSQEQLRLAEMIYSNESSQLAILIRLLQLSTNPQLLAQSISYADLGFSDDDEPGDASYNQVSDSMAKKLQKEIQKSKLDKFSDIDLDAVGSPKFDRGIELVKKLVTSGKRVVIWGIFVGTLNKIADTLRESGINVALIYGATPKDEREALLHDFKQTDSTIQVLVSNPNTLGESVSLHGVVHDAVYFEYNYNLTYMLQSRDRIHRLGLPANAQTNYYYLMTVSDNEYHNFIDEKIYTRLHEKESQMHNAIDEQILIPEFSDDVFDEMKQIVDDERP